MTFHNYKKIRMQVLISLLSFFLLVTGSQEGEGLVLSGGQYRLQTMLLPSQSAGIRRIEANAKQFIENNPGWSVDPLDKKENELCVMRLKDSTINDDDGKEFKCELIGQSGLGEILDLHDIQVKIYQPVQIVKQPKLVSGIQNGTVDIPCGATGYPNLKILWRSKDTGEELASWKANSTSGELSLLLPFVAAEENGKQYECEASTDYPATGADHSVTGVTTLKVDVPPQISLKSNTIYTDLGVEESFDIYVTGSPKPSLVCEGLQLGTPRQVIEAGSGEQFVYRVTVPNVTRLHLNNFLCEAVNEIDRDVAEIRFTLAPAVPEILSSNQTQHSDYYLLNWQTESRAPLENVTLEIEEYPTSNSSGSQMVARSPRVRKMTYAFGTQGLRQASLLTPALDNIGEGDESSSKNATGATQWRRLVWQHVANLSENTEHGISMRVCNRYDCAVSHLDSSAPRPASLTFHTQKFNGSNKVDKEVLKQPPIKIARSQRDADVAFLFGRAGSVSFNPISQLAFVLGVWWTI